MGKGYSYSGHKMVLSPCVQKGRGVNSVFLVQLRKPDTHLPSTAFSLFY
jgi:hypothetical protein